MTRIRLGRITATGLAVALTLAAATHVRADFKTIDAAIRKYAHITIVPPTPANQHPAATNQPHVGAGTSSKSPAPGSRPAKVTITNKGPAHPVVMFLPLAESLLKAKAQRARAIKHITKEDSTSGIVVVGNAPPGFGKEFDWDRSQQSALLSVFVNPADPLGVAITGLKQGDLVEVKSASGLCSFSKDTGNPIISSIIGLLGEGTSAAVDALTGSTAANTAITDAASFAQSLFKGTGAGQQFRDAFGAADTGGAALEEGGVVVCMPQAQGPYYSANPDSKNFWATNPPSIGAARGLPKAYQSMSNPPFFFLSRTPGQNVWTCGTDGVAYILAWDFAFADNAGSYNLFVKLTQGGASGSSGGSNNPPIFKRAQTRR
jgi:hypothetical protein